MNETSIHKVKEKVKKHTPLSLNLEFILNNIGLGQIHFTGIWGS